jgi:hypothetical protein
MNKQSRWVKEKTFTDETGLTVIVSRDTAVPWPKFSIAIGMLAPDGEHVMQFVPTKVVRKSVGQVAIGDVFIRLRQILESAEGYIIEQAQRLESARVDQLIERDMKRAEQDRERGLVRKSR